jgi:hypothetical protein
MRSPTIPSISTIRLLSLCLLGVISRPSYAQTQVETGKVERGPTGNTAVRLPDGLEFEFDANGQWNKIYSRYTQPVDFPDRRGIRTAQVIAEEKGKAQIVRYMQEEVSSDRLVQEVSATLQTATHTMGSGSKGELSKTTQRSMNESVREFTHSYAKGTLRGLMVIEMGYDSAAEEAWVTVGFSRKSIAIADGLSQASRLPTESKGSGSSPKEGASDSVQRQPSEVRAGPPPP